MSGVRQMDYLSVRQIVKWLVAHRPYFKQHNPIAPDIVGCGILLVEQCLEREEKLTNTSVIHHSLPSLSSSLSCPSPLPLPFPFLFLYASISPLPLSLSLLSALFPYGSISYPPPSILHPLFFASLSTPTPSLSLLFFLSLANHFTSGEVHLMGILPPLDL